MTAYPHNVTISGKSPWPWASRQVHVEEESYLKIARPFGLHWNRQIARNAQSQQVVFMLKKRAFTSANYELIEPDVQYVIRNSQPGHWVCKSDKDTLEAYRLGGSKSIVSKNGCQIAIMSLQPGLRLLNDYKIGLRVNEEKYLHLCVALALLFDDYNLHLDGGFFRQPEVSTLQPG